MHRAVSTPTGRVPKHLEGQAAQVKGQQHSKGLSAKVLLTLTFFFAPKLCVKPC